MMIRYTDIDWTDDPKKMGVFGVGFREGGIY